FAPGVWLARLTLSKTNYLGLDVVHKVDGSDLRVCPSDKHPPSLEQTRRSAPTVTLPMPKRQKQIVTAPVHQQQSRSVACAFQRRLQCYAGVHRLAIDLHDHVALLQTNVGCRTSRINLINDHAASLSVDAQPRSKLWCERHHGQAKFVALARARSFTATRSRV